MTSTYIYLSIVIFLLLCIIFQPFQQRYQYNYVVPSQTNIIKNDTYVKTDEKPVIIYYDFPSKGKTMYPIFDNTFIGDHKLQTRLKQCDEIESYDSSIYSYVNWDYMIKLEIPYNKVMRIYRSPTKYNSFGFGIYNGKVLKDKKLVWVGNKNAIMIDKHVIECIDENDN
jgi:hypothetical protein